MAEETNETNQEVAEEGATEFQAVSEASEDVAREDTITELVDEEDEGKDKLDSAETLNELLHLSATELCVLKQSWEMFMKSLGGERETVGDAIFGALSHRLTCIKEAFQGRPRAIISLNLFNGFRLLCDKSPVPEDLRVHVETLAFKHLGCEINQQRVDGVTEAFLELVTQNVPDLPPGSVNVWQKVLTYTGSCCRYISSTYTDRLKIIQDDWRVIQSAQDQEHEEGTEEHVNRSFAGMCAFSSEVIGQPTEGWMEEILQVFDVLVERIGNPSHLMEECELLAISMITKAKDIQFEKFKPVMLAALRSLLPKSWSTTHETAWEWLWATISHNLRESTIKAREFKPYNAQLFSKLGEGEMDFFRNNLYSDFLAKCPASQEIFKQSQTRLHYIADRVLQSSYEMFHTPKDEMVDDLSGLGLRHVGYGVPIELFAPFTDSCVAVVKDVVANMAKEANLAASTTPTKKISSNTITGGDSDEVQELMVEGFRWSIGLVARLLMRIITEGSTAVMQAIYQDSAQLLGAALREAPRSERSLLQLRVRVGSQAISPLYWALRSGAHTAAKTMLEDVLTIRADRDRYYYGVDHLFTHQPEVAADLLQEAPKLAKVLLDGLIWRSHKTEEGLRPVIYYMEHLVQDPDETQMISRAFVSFVRFKNPGLIVHPILVFVSDLVWDKLARSYFLWDQIFRLVNFVIFLISACFMNRAEVMLDPVWSKFLMAARVLVYTMGFGKLLYSHIYEMHKASVRKEWKQMLGIRVPKYLLKTTEMLSFFLMVDMAFMLTAEPLLHCFGYEADVLIAFTCGAWTDELSFVYQFFSIMGIFLYVALIFGIGSSISIQISEYRVLCLRAVKQVMLCFGVVALAILTFALSINAMTREVRNISMSHEWKDLGSIVTNLFQLAVGMLDLEVLGHMADESPFMLMVLAAFMLLVYTFFFNLLISQFCGVHSALAKDSEGHARLSRGEVILDTLKAVQMKRWKQFVTSLALEKRVDFAEGDIGLPGGLKVFEPAGANPKTQDQIIRFGGHTDPSLPWPEKHHDEGNSTEKMIQKTIQKSLQHYLGKKGGTDSDFTLSSSHNSSSRNGGD
ncbi:unnamed protein product [Durusdinium trenchii]|uniref:Globin family profile domain-containing protein n=1 Tax=Durusdinium trenchii TaxID=1381693 RepID=A0ABP0JL18_9DINO